jgi:uncharacterized protein (TIGR03118 family)
MLARRTPITRLTFRIFLTTLCLCAAGGSALAQYTQTNLVTTTQDPNLANAWGLAYASGGPFWVSDEHSGKSTIYDASGTIVPLVVTIPAAKAGAKGTPTGIVANSTSGFVISQNGISGPAAFLFDTLDGTVSGWNSSVNATSAVIVLNHSTTANYTGLAIATMSNGHTVIYAANRAKNQIEMYTNAFKLVKTFTDPALTGLQVYNVQRIKGKLYVAFTGKTGGAVDVFSLSGVLLKQLASNGSTGPLQDPWGLALAPHNFGVLSNALLVGNVDNGQINAFNASTGAFISILKDAADTPITNSGLWALEFGGGGGSTSNGNTDQLFITAGPTAYKAGLLAVIQ